MVSKEMIERIKGASKNSATGRLWRPATYGVSAGIAVG